MITLPTKRSEIQFVDPGLLLIYGPAKIGKTTITADLPNALHLNLEPRGTNYVNAMSYDINTMQDIVNVDEAMKSGQYKYDFVVVDTITQLEELCLPYAAKLYKSSAQGKNWDGTDVKTLASGSGYLWLRKAFVEILDVIKTWAPHIVLIGHLKDKIVDKRGTELSVSEIDLTGKIKNIVSADADAIGYVFRKDHETCISFNNSKDDVVCGSRIKHLANRVFTVATSNPDDVTEDLIINWSEIYTFINK